MMQKNENRPGYKKTKVGWIPEEWDTATLEEIAGFITKGATPTTYGYRWVCKSASSIPFLRSECVAESGFTESGLQYISREAHQYLKRSKVVPDDILMTITGNVGRVVQLPGKFNEANINQHIARIRINSCIANPMFSFQSLKHPYYQKHYRSILTGQAYPQLSLIQVRETLIPKPSLSEQEAIAEVLECWDKSIRGYEKKIEKKRNIKKGLMQRLLSGKQRLPVFSGEWKMSRFGDVFSFLKSYAISRADLISEEYPECICIIHYGDIHAKYEGAFLDCATRNTIPVIKDHNSVPVDCQYLQDGDLIIADASEDYEGIGACIELCNVGDMRIIGGLHTIVVRDNAGKTTKKYRGYMLKEYSLAKELRRIATGASVLGISKGNLSRVFLKLPSREEQQAIASVLSSADAEISALERKLASLKEQKRFLLNNLVTGTIRLPEFVKKKT